MNDADKKQFMTIMLGLAENFSAQISKPGIALRYEAMRQYDINDISLAASKILATRKIMGMPTVAEFIDAIGTMPPQLADVATNQAAIVLRYVRELGSYQEPLFDDPITRRLFKSRWSWRSVCAMTEAEHKWWAKDFIEAYQASEKVEPVMIEGSKKLKELAGRIGTHITIRANPFALILAHHRRLKWHKQDKARNQNERSK